jgi:hypothetical protein
MDGRLRFSPDELPIDGDRVTALEIAASLAVARELGALVTAETPRPTAGFLSRVMTAVAAEPAPQPVTAFARALAGGRLVPMLAALRDAWRVSTSPGRPTHVRAQALALVLLVLLAFGSLAGVAGAAVGLFDSRPPNPPLPTRPAVVPPGPSTRPAIDVPTSPAVRPSSPPNAAATPSPTPRTTPRPVSTPRRTAAPEPTETDDRSPDESREPDDSPSPGVESPSPSDNGGPG